MVTLTEDEMTLRLDAQFFTHVELWSTAYGQGFIIVSDETSVEERTYLGNLAEDAQGNRTFTTSARRDEMPPALRLVDIGYWGLLRNSHLV